MIKYIVFGLACSFIGMSSDAAQCAFQGGQECSIECVQNLGQYIDVSLVIEGHEGDVIALLNKKPDMANKLKELYTYCNSDEVLSKKSLNEARAQHSGSYYLPKHIALSPRSYALKEIREYDTLIKEIGLDKYMTPLRKPTKDMTFEEFKAYLEDLNKEARAKKRRTKRGKNTDGLITEAKPSNK